MDRHQIAQLVERWTLEGKSTPDLDEILIAEGLTLEETLAHFDKALSQLGTPAVPLHEAGMFLCTTALNKALDGACNIIDAVAFVYDLSCRFWQNDWTNKSSLAVFDAQDLLLAYLGVMDADEVHSQKKQKLSDLAQVWLSAHPL